MSSRKRNGKSSSSLPSKSKVEQMKFKFPEISEDVCETILLSVDWNIERAIRYLEQDSCLSGSADTGAETGKESVEWPALPVPPRLLQDNSNSQYGLSFHSGSEELTGLTRRLSIGSKSPNITTSSTSESVPIDQNGLGSSQTLLVKKDQGLIWQPVLSRNPRKKVDRDALQQALEEELKFENSERIIRLVSSKSGVTVPKVVILLRGVPGSGKSRLADLIVGVSEHGVSCSADDHFINQFGHYTFNPRELDAAHKKSQTNCSRAMKQNVTPIVIDNTNTQAWEMIPYVKLAVEFGYDIEILEPNTSWKRNAQILAKKNSHSVPKNKIKQMLDRWEHNLTPALLKERVLKSEKNPINEIQIINSSKMVEKEKRVPREKFQSTNFGTPTAGNLLDKKIHTTTSLTSIGLLDIVTSDNMCNGTVQAAPTHLFKHESAYCWDDTSNFPLCSPKMEKTSGNDFIFEDADLLSFEDIRRTSNSACELSRSQPYSNKKVQASVGCNYSLGSYSSSNKFESYPSSSSQPKFIPDGIRQCSTSTHAIFDRNCKSDSLLLNGVPGTQLEERLDGKDEAINLQTSANVLQNLFPDIPTNLLDDLFEACQANIGWAASILLDDGYEMVGTMEGPRQSEMFSSSKALSSSENCLPLSKTGMEIKSSDTIIASTYNLEQERSHSVPPGFSKGITDSKSSNSENVHNEVQANFGVFGDHELFVPVDGEDWFDLKLSPDFVAQVTSAYSDLESLNIASVPHDILTIRVPPKLAFELFQLFSLNWLQKSVDPIVKKESTNDTGSEVDFEDVEDDEIISQVLQMEEVTSSPSPDLEKIMLLEAKLSARDEKDTKAQLAQIRSTWADKLKLDKLQSGFPGVDRSEIELIYAKCRCSFDDSLQTLKMMYGTKFVGIPDILDDSIEKKSRRLVGHGIPERQIQVKTTIGNLSPLYVPKQNEENMTALDWRRAASKYHMLRVDCQHKMRECLRGGPGKNGASDYFLEVCKVYTNNMEYANEKAAALILKDLKALHDDGNTLDLHHLFVTEALTALKGFLKERITFINKRMIRRLDVRIITGIGKNSQRKVSRLAPAVVEYLKRQHFSFIELQGTVVVTLRYLDTRLYDT